MLDWSADIITAVKENPPIKAACVAIALKLFEYKLIKFVWIPNTPCDKEEIKARNL